MGDLILDMDIGIDDALAVLYLTAQPAVRIHAIGSSFGNTDAVTGAENGLRLLELAGLDDVPVAIGAARPLRREMTLGPEVHGDDGLGNTWLPKARRRPVRESAPQQIIRLARERPGELDILATGPLTNLAIAVVLEPALPQLIRSVVVMGGAAVGGNMSPVAEANIWKDPEAARLVFDAAWPVTMVGLDVTMRTILDEVAIDRINASTTWRGRLASRLLPYYLDFYVNVLGSERRVCPLHDPLAAGVVVDPSLVRQVADGNVEIACDGPARGMTIVDRRPHDAPARAATGRHRVVMEVDSDRFVESLVAALTT